MQIVFFDKNKFRDLLLRARGDRDNEQYARDSGVSRTYISMYLNLRRDSAPSPDILKKLARVSQNNVSYDDLMSAAEYFEADGSEYSPEPVMTPEEERAFLEQYPLNDTEELDAVYSEEFRKLFNTYSYAMRHNLSPDQYAALLNQRKAFRIPVLGQIRAGIPILADQNIEGHLEVPSSLRADFALRVAGDSMSGAGILEGDIVICRETQTPQSGQIVVALKDEGDTSEATLKYFFNGQQPVLKAANPKYADLDYTDGYRVAGVMVACVREDAPGYQVYRDSLAVQDKEEWTEVIEKAAAAGIKPEHLKAIIDMHLSMLKGK